MKATSIKFGLSSSTNQQDIVQLLSGSAIKTIQTASGLCAASAPETINKILSEHNIEGLSVAELTEEERETPDIAAFLRL